MVFDQPFTSTTFNAIFCMRLLHFFLNPIYLNKPFLSFKA
jgi:hypothetical protein